MKPSQGKIRISLKCQIFFGETGEQVLPLDPLAQPLNPTKTYLPKVSQLRNKTCLASAGRGWYLYSSIVDCRCLFLLNPITLEKITLPPLNCIDFCILSSTPREPGCMVVLFVLEPRLIIYCDDGEWIELAYFDELRQSLEKADNGMRCMMIPFACCNGNLYAVTRSGYILVMLMLAQNFN